MRNLFRSFFISTLILISACSPDSKEIKEVKAAEVKPYAETIKSQKPNSELTPEQQKAIDSLDALLED